ncbi:MAG: hypothetical protein LC672_05310, partial [Acidobacteria bacterium]|nr:hypothetical protein [Acidobacteriota bacterium]
GWGDIYEWNRPGNYVALTSNYQTPTGAPRPGFYLMQGRTDPLGLVKETNEKDNFSYALIEILDDGSVKLWERGYGRNPWSGPRVVLTEAP